MNYCTGCGSLVEPNKLNKDHLCSYCIARRGKLLKRYNISLSDYNRLLHAQDFKCYICSTHIKDHKSALVIDHDHDTHKIRGLLCKKCNLALGLFKDSTSLLRKAISYLNKNDT